MSRADVKSPNREEGASGGHPLLGETPPCAWGSLTGTDEGSSRDGNTPTCVGKTDEHHRTLGTVIEHPHVRGEDCS